ncbi:tyrosine-type recombinase/integrase [Rhodoligotrophos ferricapiens]|uniref:tyrosine-type recombinase/integrase n=1 Tax=Rhodoligotrophos ferricapiens TaxID=3069264 RepID=UPI00315CCB52
MSVRKRTWRTSSGEDKSSWVVDYVDTKGKRRLKTFRLKKEADAFAATANVEVRQGVHVADSASLTISEAAEIWHKAVAVGRNGRDPAEASTLRQYRTHIDRHIVPALGHEKLSRLTTPRARAFRDELLEKLSRPMAKKVLTSFKSIIREAQSRGLVMANVAAPVTIQTGGGNNRHREEVTIPEPAEIRALLAKLEQLATQPNKQWSKAWRRWRALISTAIYTGCRASELRGMPWEAIDLKAGTITVKQRADENGKIGSPKSAAGRRTINIPAQLVATLREWKLESPKGPLVFPNWQGKVESLANIHTRCWRPLLIAAAVAVPKLDDAGNVVRDKEGQLIMLPKYNFHALRHFRASLLINDGANPKEVQVEMGHSSITITLGLYGHIFRDEEADKRRRDRAERLASSLG